MNPKTLTPAEMERRTARFDKLESYQRQNLGARLASLCQEVAVLVVAPNQVPAERKRTACASEGLE